MSSVYTVTSRPLNICKLLFMLFLLNQICLPLCLLSTCIYQIFMSSNFLLPFIFLPFPMTHSSDNDTAITNNNNSGFVSWPHANREEMARGTFLLILLNKVHSGYVKAKAKYFEGFNFMRVRLNPLFHLANALRRKFYFWSKSRILFLLKRNRNQEHLDVQFYTRNYAVKPHGHIT